MEEKVIKKVKLSDGSVYSVFDNDSFRLNQDGILVTGNGVVDKVILQGHLYITQIDDIDVAVDNVLTQNASTGEIMRRDADKLLEDIGGASYKMNDSTGVLSLKIGKQQN